MILKDEIINRIRIRQGVTRLKKYDAIKDKKKLEVLLKVTQSVYHKNPDARSDRRFGDKSMP